MKKLLQIIPALIISFLFQQNLNAQKVEKTKEPINYTIENCVNEFDLSKAKKTNSGYQYWFADKKFTEENTLKMSIVEPGKSTHAPHRHPEEEFFIFWKGKHLFILMVKPWKLGQIPVCIVRQTQNTELAMLEIKI